MKKENQNLTLENIRELFDEQTKVILEAVDSKLAKTDSKISRLDDKIDKAEIRLLQRMEQMETRINKKIEKLTTTLDGFLKRMIDMETEFASMKADLNRVKNVLREKLGVAID